MMNKHLLLKTLIFSLIFVQFSCSHKWKITDRKSDKIAIDSTADALVDSRYVDSLQIISDAMDAQLEAQIGMRLDDVVGKSARVMKAKRPQSLLSNFASDLLRKVASKKLGKPIDIGIMNMGGLRKKIPAGNVTVRNLNELIFTENELVVISMTGDMLQKIIDSIAYKGGEGVSGIRMTIHKNKPQNVTVNGKPIDVKKTYTIATINFLANGKDGLGMNHYTSIDSTGLKLFNIFLDEFIDATKHGKTVDAEDDVRIDTI